MIGEFCNFLGYWFDLVTFRTSLWINASPTYGPRNLPTLDVPAVAAADTHTHTHTSLLVFLIVIANFET